MAPDSAIIVDHVNKAFKLPHEKVSSIKGALINFRKRRRSYEMQQVLHDISFEVKKGEFFGIVGRNGSGKSTLLKLLAGIYAPNSGQIHTNGKLTPFIELGVGFNPELTGRENVFLNGALLGFNRQEMLAMYNDIVLFAELERFMDQKLKNYSSGMQVRLAFSIAIRARGEILLLDEVLAVGDAAFQQKCYNYFEELKQQKKTVVFVSHDMTAVRRFCNKAVYVKNGELILEGTATEVADLYELENIEGAKDQDSKQKDSKHSIRASIEDQTGEAVELEFTYAAKDSDEYYIGMSVLREGVSVAEIITSLDAPLVGSGKVAYSLDTRKLNSGTYEVGGGLFRMKNRELVAIVSSRNRFVIKGSDSTRGGALKLADTWKYES
jgi:ABC-type polysaccharide/polyol phosphate transport system ATPase subunit